MIFKSKYAINPNIDMAFGILRNLESERYTSVEYLSKKLKCSAPTIKHTGKFLFLADVIETRKGTGGGYRLRQPLDKIYLRELVSLTCAERVALQKIFQLSGHLTVKDFLAIL